MESTKNSDVRANNRKRVVNTLFREGPMTKQELALRLDISLPTVTLLLKEITEKGLVTKGEVLSSTGGRKPVCITPVYDIKYSIGAEITMHEIRLVMIDLGSNIVVKESYPYGLERSREYWEKINCVLMDFMDKNIKDRDKLLDIGITLQIPMKDGAAMWKKDTPQEQRVDLELAESCFELPVKFRNSAKMAAIAQIWALNDRENFVFVSLGSYVGGGIVYNSVIMGFSELNGQFGSLMMGPEHKKLEEVCTAKSICQRAGVASVDELMKGIEEGNIRFQKIWEEYLDTLSIMFYNLHCIFGWKIVIGGSMSPYLAGSKEKLEYQISRMNDLEEEDASYIHISDLGAYGAAVGAAMLPIDEFLEFGYNEL